MQDKDTTKNVFIRKPLNFEGNAAKLNKRTGEYR